MRRPDVIGHLKTAARTGVGCGNDRAPNSLGAEFTHSDGEVHIGREVVSTDRYSGIGHGTHNCEGWDAIVRSG